MHAKFRQMCLAFLRSKAQDTSTVRQNKSDNFKDVQRNSDHFQQKEAKTTSPLILIKTRPQELLLSTHSLCFPPSS